MRKYGRELIIETYGNRVVELACEYFDNKEAHCNIEEFESKCKELKKEMYETDE